MKSLYKEWSRDNDMSSGLNAGADSQIYDSTVGGG